MQNSHSRGRTTAKGFSGTEEAVDHREAMAASKAGGAIPHGISAPEPAPPNPPDPVEAHKAMGGDVIACRLVEALSDIAEGKKSYLPAPCAGGPEDDR